MVRSKKTTVFICSLTFTLIAGPVFSKSNNLNKSISNIEAKYQLIYDLSADFVQKTHVKILERDVEKKGRIYLKKDGKLKIVYNEKGSKQYISNGKILKVFVPGDAGTLQIFPLSDRDIPREALSFLIGFGKLKDEFKVSYSKEYSQIEDNYTALHLIPKNKNSVFRSMDALFNEDSLLRKLIVINASGNVSTYSFFNVKTDSGLSDEIFDVIF